jgi:hypothetical protein
MLRVHATGLRRQIITLVRVGASIPPGHFDEAALARDPAVLDHP